MKRYVVTVFVTLLAWLAIVSCLNYVVDPYFLWGAVRKSGFNDVKPAAAKRSRVTKSYAVLRADPKTLVVGNSRPEMGLDPLSRQWPAAMQPIYSLTLPGAHLHLHLLTAAHAITAGEVNDVLLGVDFVDFLVVGQARQRPEELPERLPETHRLFLTNFDRPNGSRQLEAAKDGWASLVSLEAALDSLHTLASRSARDVSNITATGFNPAWDYARLVRDEGQQALFDKTNQDMARRLGAGPPRLFEGAGEWSRWFELLTRFLQFAADRDINVRVFINPYHADYLDTIAHAKYWGAFEKWKTVLAEICAKHATPCWDFSDYDRYSVQTTPESGRRELTWFWEPAHYRAELGDLMLARMLKDANDSDFGEKISPETLSIHLKNIRERQAQYWQREATRTAKLARLATRNRKSD